MPRKSPSICPICLASSAVPIESQPIRAFCAIRFVSYAFTALMNSFRRSQTVATNAFRCFIWARWRGGKRTSASAIWRRSPKPSASRYLNCSRGWTIAPRRWASARPISARELRPLQSRPSGCPASDRKRLDYRALADHTRRGYIEFGPCPPDCPGGDAPPPNAMPSDRYSSASIGRRKLDHGDGVRWEPVRNRRTTDLHGFLPDIHVV